MAKSKRESRLSDVIDKIADEKARDQILGARVMLVIRHPFFGQLAMRLKLVNADQWCETAATDGRHFYYNTKFVNELKAEEMMFLFCHELLHAAYEHCGRTLPEHNRHLANVAMDYVINQDLIRHNLGQKLKVGLYEKKYEGWSWEAVYDDLMQNVQKINIDDLVDQLIDEHLEGEGEGGNGDKEGQGKGRPKISESERQAIKDEFREAMLSAANSTSQGAGNLPGNLQKMIKDLTEPKINWREMIRQQIQSTVRNDYTYRIPSRKNFANGFTMPSMQRDQSVEVHVAVDVSGSISDKQARDFFSEIKGIMDSFDDYKVTVWCFDTRISNPQSYETYGNEDISSYEIMGGGGTDFDCNWTYMKANDIRPKMFIMFTDGEPYGSWGDPDYCDTLWIISNPYNKGIVPPFGLHCNYEEADQK
jgi:predicted metal-dependent peptidase